MKNERLKSLMAHKLASGKSAASGQVQVLNKEELMYTTAGRGCDCPNLTTCGTFCSNNCGVKVGS